jgi:uncharacterized protein (TIGR04255 family)
MLSAGKTIPSKLKVDAIVEAAFEIRFDTPTLPEVLFGRFVDTPGWQQFRQVRLPAYEIPDPIRQVDRNLRYAPVFELQDGVGHRSIRIGPHVISYHQRAPYVGWNALRSELGHAIDGLFVKAQDVTIRRLGIRYVNALLRTAHQINSLTDLDIRVLVGGEPVAQSVNLNFSTIVSPEIRSVVRVGTPDSPRRVATNPDAAVVVDIEVYNGEQFKAKLVAADVQRWMEAAHTHEKEMFFNLFTPETIAAWQEE